MSYLIGDIGGTNARLALLNDATVEEQVTLNCADFPAPEQAIAHYLKDHPVASLSGISLAAAGPVTQGVVKFTNNHWELNEQRLSVTFDTSVRIINDFEAITLALPALAGAQNLVLGDTPPLQLNSDEYCLAVVGPGTGLGAAGLLCQRGVPASIITEAGHTGFAPETRFQRELLIALLQQHERVSMECLLSGPGIVDTYAACAMVAGLNVAARNAADVFLRAETGNDAVAEQAINVFFEVLGQFAGDFVLSIGAWDGLFLGGGILQRYPERLSASSFRERFEDKGKHARLVRRVPSVLLKHSNPGLIGAGIAASGS